MHWGRLCHVLLFITEAVWAHQAAAGPTQQEAGEGGGPGERPQDSCIQGEQCGTWIHFELHSQAF